MGDKDTTLSFWMENTYIDLDLIFVDSMHRIVDIKPARKLDLTSVSSSVPAKDAIEVPMGWCRNNHVYVGDTVEYKLKTKGYFIARNVANFGASRFEIDQAVRDGNYDNPFR